RSLHTRRRGQALPTPDPPRATATRAVASAQRLSPNASIGIGGPGPKLPGIGPAGCARDTAQAQRLRMIAPPAASINALKKNTGITPKAPPIAPNTSG